MVSFSLGKKCWSSVTHSTPMKPAPTTRMVAPFSFRPLMKLNLQRHAAKATLTLASRPGRLQPRGSSRMCRRRPSKNRSSRCGQEPAGSVTASVSILPQAVPNPHALDKPSGRASSWMVGNHRDSPHLGKQGLHAGARPEGAGHPTCGRDRNCSRRRSGSSRSRWFPQVRELILDVCVFPLAFLVFPVPEHHLQLWPGGYSPLNSR